MSVYEGLSTVVLLAPLITTVGLLQFSLLMYTVSMSVPHGLLAFKIRVLFPGSRVKLASIIFVVALYVKFVIC